MRGNRVAVKTDEGITVHCASSYADWDTLCGIDSNDPAIGHFGTIDVPITTKIDCAACKAIFCSSRNYKISDFK